MENLARLIKRLGIALMIAGALLFVFFDQKDMASLMALFGAFLFVLFFE